jgi:hypothetical protein
MMALWLGSLGVAGIRGRRFFNYCHLIYNSAKLFKKPFFFLWRGFYFGQLNNYLKVIFSEIHRVEG